MALVDYRGYRLIATCLLPIDSTTLIYGSSDAGVTAYAKSKRFNRYATEIGQSLNLRPHIVGIVKKRTLMFGGDVEGHRGKDGRYYLLDFSRILPPTRPVISAECPNSHLYMQFRIEFSRKYKQPLCSDGYSLFIQNDPLRETYNNDLNDAMNELETKVIPSFAKESLSIFMEAFEGGYLETLSVTEYLHRRGINMRYCGLVCHALSQLNSPHAQFCLKLVLIESCARAVKNILFSHLRSLTKRSHLTSLPLSLSLSPSLSVSVSVSLS